MVYRKLNDFENAILDYTSELKYGSENEVKVLTNRAYCYAKLSEYNKAILDYTNVLEIDNNNIHALHNRGISCERMGQFIEVNYIYIYIYRQ